jgi:Zn-dependent peptidase ImmA (M78 family)/transcriptional regulator with XRE-family HTH domain
MSNLFQFPDRATGFVPYRLTEARLAKHMSRAELARELDVTGQAVGYYETGERRPDMSTLLRISEILKQPVSFFLKPTSVSQTGEIGTRFFRSVGPKTQKTNNALQVKTKWLWEIVDFISREIRLPAVDLPQFEARTGSSEYSLADIEDIARETRRQFGFGDGPISNMVATLETRGVVVTRFEIEDGAIDAFSCWVGGRPYVMLGSDKRSSCRSRFDAAHELGHLVLHRDITQEDISDKKTLARIEREANWFAGSFLLPREKLLQEFYSTRMSHLEGLKARWRVSMQAIAHRAKDVGAIDEYQYILFRKQISHNKWLSVEPLDRDIPLEQPAFLLKCWKLLVERGKVPEVSTEDAIGFSLELVQRLCGVVPECVQPQEPLTPRLIN